MPGARTHDFITVVTAAAGAPVLLNSGLPDLGNANPTNALVLVGAYLTSGLLFSPDLDLRSAPYKRWRQLRWMWLPYQKLVRHRSWVSHSLLAGPLLRVIYFAGVLFLLALAALGLLNLFVPVDPTGTLLNLTNTIAKWIEAHPAVIGYAVLGFVLGGAAHSLTDTITTAVRRKL
jgi:uncharacterized metal-binding protein